MHRVTERIEYCGDLIRYLRVEPPDVVLGDRNVFGERAVAIDADDLDAFADVRLPGAAEQARKVGDVSFCRDALADLNGANRVPIAATLPMNSCPTTSGGLIRCCAHASHR